MKLNLRRPMVFFDLETTGTNISTDRIVEISVVKVMPDGSIDRGKPFTKRINPTIPIPAEATAVHHITNEDVADCPTFKQVAANLKKYIEGCDFCGFNSNRFDLPLLAEELIRAGVYKPVYDDVKSSSTLMLLMPMMINA
jgi:DNA polymerase-3 subunit epsilon